MRLTLILNNCIKRTKEWRDASTLILVRQKLNSEKDALEYLMTERSKQSTFMPGGMCFPGGTVAAADGSKEWIDMYRKIGTDLTKLQFLQPGARRPEIYDSEPEFSAALSKEVSLRITTIRETFEECGILLCRPMDTKLKVPKYKYLQTDSVIRDWQNRIKENPGDFVTLCSELNIVPDLGALHEWSNWLTPVAYKSAKYRFDTMFYIAFLTESPETVIDTHEVASLLWSTAEEFYNEHCSGKKLLLPPQLYEMVRIRNIERLETMQALAKLRLRLGVEQWCPFLKQAQDGLLGILPGDDKYPINPDLYTYCEKEQLSGTMDAEATTVQQHHRWQLPKAGTGRYSLLINTPDRYGQVYST